jgi:hypothetical protein
MLLLGIYTFVHYISACTNHLTMTLAEYCKVSVVLSFSPFGIVVAQEGMSNCMSFF